MGDSERLTVTRTVAAGPAQVFAVLADPARHTEVDGAEMLRGLADGYADKIGNLKPGGHTYTWELEPDGTGTKVTQIYDWSGVGDPNFKGLFPMLKEEHLGETIDRVGRAAAR